MTDLALPYASAGQPASAERRGRGGPTCVFLACAAVLLAAPDGLLKDPDTHWHIAVGRWIWQSRAVPWTDPFSHTFAGAPWIAKEWLSQMLMYGAFALAGWRGVVALATASIATAFALLFAWLEKRVAVAAAAGATVFAVVLASPSLIARPHVLTFPIALLWTAALVDSAERRASPPWAALPLMVLWANLHGTFTLGYAFAGILAADAVARAPRGARARAAARWALFLGGAVTAGLATPYGYHAMLVTVTLVGSGEPLPYITEWRPIGFTPVGVIAIAGLAAGAALLARAPRENAFRLALVTLVGYMMVRHTRFACLFGLVAPIACAGPLVRRLPRLRAMTRSRPPVPAVPALALVTAGLAFLAAPRPDPRTTPDAALAAARARGLTGPVYNDYNFGGFLIARGVPTFIDGRTDQLFLGGFMSEVRRTETSASDSSFARLIARYGVRWALVQPGSDASRHLDALPGWRPVYADAVAAVYAGS